MSFIRSEDKHIYNVGIPIIDLSNDTERQIITDREENQYIGHPDLVLLDDGTIFTVYPKGHGQGPIILKRSINGGKTWSNRLPTPKSWEQSKETPTIYLIEKPDGIKRLQLISGMAFDREANGFKTAFSEDNGQTWTELEHFFSDRELKTIVALSSLTRLKKADGSWDFKYMGIFHDFSFNNFKVYLTFDDEGNECWSEPERLLKQHDEVEKYAKMCEIEVLRSPCGNQLALIARGEGRITNSMIAFSNDEGETWTEPRELPKVLTGDRHKACYDPISSRLLITFRQIIREQNDDNAWRAGNFVCWVGTYDDLLNNKEGQYSVILLNDYTVNPRFGDCGYAGNIALDDGTFVITSYGHWDKIKPELPYIMTVRLKLSELDNKI